MKQNFELGLSFLLKSKEKSNTNAISLLGDLFAVGICVEKDLGSAIENHKMAAEAGSLYSMNIPVKLSQ